MKDVTDRADQKRRYEIIDTSDPAADPVQIEADFLGEPAPFVNRVRSSVIVSILRTSSAAGKTSATRSALSSPASCCNRVWRSHSGDIRSPFLPLDSEANAPETTGACCVGPAVEQAGPAPSGAGLF